jgi:zinc protease
MLCLAAGSALAAPPPLQQRVLPNGLTVVVVEDHAQPLLTVEIAAHNGSMTEPPDYNGLSHLYEHMFFKGNQALPDQEAWLRRARALGVSWNGTTSTERVNYFFTTTSDQLAETLTFMRDAIVTPRFDPGELDRERVVVTGEMDRNEANPFYHLYEAGERRVWWKYPSRKLPLGSRQTVLKTTVAQMQTIQSRYYVPNNSLLVLTGDVQAEAAFALVGSLFAGWTRGPDPFLKFPLVQHPPLPQTSVVLVQQPVETVSGLLTWHGPSVKGEELPQTYAADMLAFAVAEPSSKFQQRLVDSGACAAVSFGWATQVNVGPVVASFQATREMADRCITAILSELSAMRAPGYVSDEELANAALRAELDKVHEREKPSELAHVLTFWWASGGLDYYLGYVDHMREVRPPQLTAFLDRYVIGKPFVLSVMVSPEAARGGLDLQNF